MSNQPKNPRPVLIAQVNFLWYLVAIVPILGLGYAALVNWVPGMFVLIAVFAFFMWLFSLGFTVYAVITRKRKERKESRQ
ncbi:MAG: hypothetical protein ACOH2N_17795 [Devosia sp.]